MQRLRVGDVIRVIHKGNVEKVCTIMDVLEDYDGNTYWLKSETGRMILEIETPDIVFEKITSINA